MVFRLKYSNTGVATPMPSPVARRRREKIGRGRHWNNNLYPLKTRKVGAPTSKTRGIIDAAEGRSVRASSPNLNLGWLLGDPGVRSAVASICDLVIQNEVKASKADQTPSALLKVNESIEVVESVLGCVPTISDLQGTAHTDDPLASPSRKTKQDSNDQDPDSQKTIERSNSHDAKAQGTSKDDACDLTSPIHQTATENYDSDANPKKTSLPCPNTESPIVDLRSGSRGASLSTSDHEEKFITTDDGVELDYFTTTDHLNSDLTGKSTKTEPCAEIPNSDSSFRETSIETVLSSGMLVSLSTTDLGDFVEPGSSPPRSPDIKTEPSCSQDDSSDVTEPKKKHRLWVPNFTRGRIDFNGGKRVSSDIDKRGFSRRRFVAKRAMKTKSIGAEMSSALHAPITPQHQGDELAISKTMSDDVTHLLRSHTTPEIDGESSVVLNETPQSQQVETCNTDIAVDKPRERSLISVHLMTAEPQSCNQEPELQVTRTTDNASRDDDGVAVAPEASPVAETCISTLSASPKNEQLQVEQESAENSGMSGSVLAVEEDKTRNSVPPSPGDREEKHCAVAVEEDKTRNSVPPTPGDHEEKHCAVEEDKTRNSVPPSAGDHEEKHGGDIYLDRSIDSCSTKRLCTSRSMTGRLLVSTVFHKSWSTPKPTVTRDSAMPGSTSLMEQESRDPADSAVKTEAFSRNCSDQSIERLIASAKNGESLQGCQGVTIVPLFGFMSSLVGQCYFVSIAPAIDKSGLKTNSAENDQRLEPEQVHCEEETAPRHSGGADENLPPTEGSGCEYTSEQVVHESEASVSNEVDIANASAKGISDDVETAFKLKTHQSCTRSHEEHDTDPNLGILRRVGNDFYVGLLSAAFFSQLESELLKLQTAIEVRAKQLSETSFCCSGDDQLWDVKAATTPSATQQSIFEALKQLLGLDEIAPPFSGEEKSKRTLIKRPFSIPISWPSFDTLANYTKVSGAQSFNGSRRTSNGTMTENEVEVQPTLSAKISEGALGMNPLWVYTRSDFSI